MRILLVLVVILFVSCSINRKKIIPVEKSISKLTFLNYHDIDQEGVNSTKLIVDSMITKEIECMDLSEEEMKMMKNIPYEDILMSFFTPKSEATIDIKINNDSITKYKKHGDEIIGNITKFYRDSIFLYKKEDNKLITSRKQNPKLSSEYSYKEFPADRKIISNYDCFKVILKVKSKEEKSIDFPFLLGDAIYEMYVTDQIKLPNQIILKYNIEELNYFPVEIQTWLENMKGMTEIYKLINVE